MAAVTLGDILDLIGDNQTEYDKAASGQGSGPSSDWETSDLPLTREYRVKVFKAEVKNSKAGNTQIVLSLEVLEPEEFAGKKFQEYVNPAPTNEVGSKVLSQLFGALRADATGLGKNDLPLYVDRFIDKTMVVTLRRWGSEMDRTSLRFTNFDAGQELRENITPPKVSAPKKDLRPDINIPRREVSADGPFPATPPIAIPTTASVSVPNLPPGLRQ